MPYAHIDPSIYKQIARAINSGQTDITFPDPFVSAIDTGLQVTISGTVTITPDAPPDPSVGYEGSDHIDLLLQTSIIAEAAAQIRNNADLRDACIDEYNRFGSQEPLQYHGARFTLRETGTTYDYTLCGDPVLLRLLQEKETLDAKIKEREKFLRNLPREGIEATDETTGEITRIYPPARSSATNIAITLPR